MAGYNLIGMMFGKLSVIEQTGNESNKNKKRKYWLCNCVCGGNSIVSSSDLVSGKTKQCKDCGRADTGRAKRKTIVGNKYGMLTVVNEIYGIVTKSGKKITKCECICDCGEKVLRTRDHLFQSEVPSCGCVKREIIRKACGTNVDGEKFGRLTVIETLWDESPVKLKCSCDCGVLYIGV